jgi:predicted Zn-dependent protease
MTTSCQKTSERRSGIATVAGGLFAILLWAAGANAEPYRPRDPETVLLRLAGVSIAAPAPIASPSAVLEKARNEMHNGRLTLDERYFGRARALLENALRCVSYQGAAVSFERCDEDATSSSLLSAYADVLQHGHEFENAERGLNRVLQADPMNERARVMRASVRLARGQPREALQDCAALISADSLVATACIAQAMGLNGRLAEAHRLLSDALSRTSARNERTAWAFAILAELAERRGRDAEALDAIELALSANPDDATLKIQAADLMLRMDRPERAAEVLAPLARIESVLLRRALAAKRSGLANAPTLLHEWQASAQLNSKLGRRIHLRDATMAALYLEARPELALRHAIANWNESKEIEDARLLIAAAIAARQPQAAAPALRWVDAFDIEDVLIERVRSRAAL